MVSLNKQKHRLFFYCQIQKLNSYYNFIISLFFFLFLMTSYIVKNGRLEIRQNDNNVPNYRIIPYKSSINPTTNDYYLNSIDELQKQTKNLKEDYRNLAQTMWKVFSQIDMASYDPRVIFTGLKTEQIYDKISLIRSLNAYEPEEESLQLSAIRKNDQQANIFTKESNSPIKKCINTPIFDKVIKQQNLYEIQEEQECHSHYSRVLIKKSPKNIKQPSSFIKCSQETHPARQDLNHCRRLSINSNSGHKVQNRRTSLILRQKISLAFHQQQELRQLLEEQLEKLSQQLEQKNQYLSWTVEQLKNRNQIIQRLKEILILRDKMIQFQQAQINSLDKKQINQKFQQKDKEIGQIINSLIQRTQQTFQDLQFLTKSIHPLQQNIQEEKQNEQAQQQDQGEKSIDIDSIIYEAKSQIQDQIVTENTLKENQQNQFSQEETEKDEKQVDKQVGNNNTNKIYTKNQPQNIQMSVLQPRKMNFDQPLSDIKLLTKQDFLKAQQNGSQNCIISNVKMTQSFKYQ